MNERHRTEAWRDETGRRDRDDWSRRESWSGREPRSWSGEGRDPGRHGADRGRGPYAEDADFDQGRYTGRYSPAWSDHDEARLFGGYRRPTYRQGGGYGRGGRAQEARWPESSGRDYGRGYQELDPYTSRFAGRWDYGGTEYHGRDRDWDARDDDRNWWDRTRDRVARMFSDDDRDDYGGHHGRGPKGYRRSDGRIHEDVNDALTYDAWLDASDIEVAVKDSEVTLSGTVASRADKRRAEDCVDRVSGVTHVQNNLRVKEPGGEDRLASSGGSQGRRGAGPTTGLVS